MGFVSFGPQTWPQGRPVNEWAAVAKYLVQQLWISSRRMEWDQLDGEAQAPGKPFVQRFQGARRGAAELDQDVNVGDPFHLVSSGNRTEQHRKCHLRLGPEHRTQTSYQRPMRTDPGGLRLRQRDASRTRPATAKQAAGDCTAKRSLVDADLAR